MAATQCKSMGMGIDIDIFNIEKDILVTLPELEQQFESKDIIKVLVPRLKSYEEVIDYYNQNKPLKWEPLSKLNRAEGGFQIALSPIELDKHIKYLESRFGNNLIDENDEIKQLRWSNGMLRSNYHMGFTKEETMLLYKALQNSLGKEYVILESLDKLEKYSNINSTVNSKDYLISIPINTLKNINEL